MATTWNPADKSADMSLSNGDLTGTIVSSVAYDGARATIGRSSGKWYWEVTADDVNSGSHNFGIGIDDLTALFSELCYIGSEAYVYIFSGYKGHNTSAVAYGDTYTDADVIGIALDLDNGKIWFSKNDVWQASGDPAAGTNEAYSGISGTFYPFVSGYTSGDKVTANFGASAFSGTIPSGFTDFDGELLGEITDGAGIADLIEGDDPYRDFTDGVGISDQIEGDSPYRDITDGVGIDDTLVRSLIVDKSISEESGIADATATALIWEGLVSNTTGINDALARSIEIEKSIIDETGSADAFTAGAIYSRILLEILFSWDTPKWGWNKSIAESMAIAETVEKILGIPVSEWLSLIDTQTNTWKGVESLSDGFYLVDIPKAIQVYDDLIEDGMAVTDAARIALTLLITDILTCTDTIVNTGTFQHAIEDEMTLADIVRRFFPKSISDSFAATDTSILDLLALLQISDTITITEATTPGLTINKVIADALDAADTVTLQQFLQELITDGLNLEVLVELDDEVWECWSLNTAAFHPSVYSGYDYNSFAEYNNTVYGCRSDGIYELEGDTDNGTAFHSGIILPETNFGSAHNKRFRKAWFGVSGDDLVMKMETDNGWKTFSMVDKEMAITRDLKGRSWRISLEDFDSLDMIELIPVILSRK